MNFCLLLIFQNHFFLNISGIPSECQTVWIQIRPEYVGPDQGPNCLQRVSADETSSQKVNEALDICSLAILGYGNTMPNFCDLVPFHSGQVGNFNLPALGQV